MSSHFSRLQQQFAAKEHELKERIKTVETLAEITRQLESQKQALAEKSAELNDHSDEVTKMKSRLDLLSDLAPPLDAAMHNKSTSGDVVNQVLESAIRSMHLSAGDIVEKALRTVADVQGLDRRDSLIEVLDGLIDDEEGLKVAIETAMDNFAGVKDVVKLAIAMGLERGANAEALTEDIAKTVFDMLGTKASAEPIKETPIVNLPKENAPPGGQSQATLGNNNGLRGQAKDFMPQNDTNESHRSGGWESFARENGMGNDRGNQWSAQGGSGWVFSTRAGW